MQGDLVFRAIARKTKDERSPDGGREIRVEGRIVVVEDDDKFRIDRPFSGDSRCVYLVDDLEKSIFSTPLEAARNMTWETLRSVKRLQDELSEAIDLRRAAMRCESDAQHLPIASLLEEPTAMSRDDVLMLRGWLDHEVSDEGTASIELMELLVDCDVVLGERRSPARGYKERAAARLLAAWKIRRFPVSADWFSFEHATILSRRARSTWEPAAQDADVAQDCVAYQSLAVAGSPDAIASADRLVAIWNKQLAALYDERDSVARDADDK